MFSRSATARLARDLKQLQKEPLVGANAAPSEDDMSLWNAVIHVPLELNQSQVVAPLHFRIDFPSDYPNAAPNVGFSVSFPFRIGASYVQSSGRLQGCQVLCLDLLGNFANVHTEWKSSVGSGWSPAYSVTTLLVNLQSVLLPAGEDLSTLERQKLLNDCLTFEAKHPERMCVVLSATDFMQQLQQQNEKKQEEAFRLRLEAIRLSSDQVDVALAFAEEANLRSNALFMDRLAFLMEAAAAAQHSTSTLSTSNSITSSTQEKEQQGATCSNPSDTSKYITEVEVAEAAEAAEAGAAKDKLAEAKPAEPAKAEPAEAAEAKPAEAKPAEAKPAEVKPAEAKPAEAKPAEANPAEAKPAEAEAAEAVDTNIVCYSTKLLYTETMLGYGIHVTRQGMQVNLSTPAELLSVVAFDEGLRQSTLKLPFEAFLPAFINPKHSCTSQDWVTRLQQVVHALGKHYNCKNLNESALAVFPKLINTLLVEIMSPATPKSMALAYFEALLSFWRTFYFLMVRVPAMAQACCERLHAFTTDEAQRLKAVTPDVGALFALFACCPSKQPSFQDFIAAYVDEAYVRSALYWMKDHTQLTSQALFSATTVGRNIAMFQSMFVRSIIGPNPAKAANEMDASNGKMTARLEVLQNEWRAYLDKTKTWDVYFRRLGLHGSIGKPICDDIPSWAQQCIARAKARGPAYTGKRR